MRIIPLHNNVLIKLIENQKNLNNNLILTNPKVKLLYDKGIVVAIGFKSLENTQFGLNIGSVVLTKAYAGMGIMINNCEHKIIDCNDIVAIIYES